mmetsp:Transcript_8697/g.27695  ORF Transcript_8697/g.27695 Transcript_8697/m.27695 type:complete len:309 (-) Transcript_8697:232-1158(-)
MPTTGWAYSPMDSSFKCTSAWNMASPTLVPASQAGSKRFTCHCDLARSSALLGSSENMGSRPSRIRTCSASAKYSRFKAAAGFAVGAMRAVLDSSAKVRVYMPFATGAKPILRAQARFRGTRSAFQPMSNSARRDFFRSASRRLRFFSSLLARCSKSCAWHSPCMRGPPSSLRYAKSPIGSWHSGQTSGTSSARTWQPHSSSRAGFGAILLFREPMRPLPCHCEYETTSRPPTSVVPRFCCLRARPMVGASLRNMPSRGADASSTTAILEGPLAGASARGPCHGFTSSLSWVRVVTQPVRGPAPDTSS